VRMRLIERLWQEMCGMGSPVTPGYLREILRRTALVTSKREWRDDHKPEDMFYIPELDDTNGSV